jgi:hypothetical protein
MKVVKYGSAFILVIFCMVLWQFSSMKELREDQAVLLKEYEEIPDFDYRSMATNLWKQGQQEEALAALKIIIEQELPDAAAAEVLYGEYLREIVERSSGLGKMKAFGMAFVTGEVSSFEELAGSSLADFFIYGDVRDLGREILSGNNDPLIVSLSSIGLLTTVFPPADPVASLMKTAHKSKSLTGGLTKQLSIILAPLKQGLSKLSRSQLKNMLNMLTPIWDLAKNCQTWQQFSSFLKQCKNIKQVKFINKVISKAGNSKKLSALLCSVGNLPSQSLKVLDFIRSYGQKGMDSLYGVLRKGPAGLQFLMKNPGLYAKLAKNSVKTSRLLSSQLQSQWQDFLLKYGVKAEVLRYGIMFLSFFLAVGLIFGFRVNKTKVTREVETPLPKGFKKMLFYGGSVLLFLVFISRGSGVAEESMQMDTTSKGNGLNTFSLFFFIAFGALQIWAILKTKREVEEIKMQEGRKTKLALLENSEFYFDLPVYTGLAGTVCAFILINVDPSGSRMLAYVTTVSGIIISVALRGLWLFPMKKEILGEVTGE